MSKIGDPIERARKASTKVQAARLYQELDAELGLADHGPEWEAQAEQAQDMLEAKSSEHGWGDLNDSDATTAYVAAGRGQHLAHAWAGPSFSRSAQKFLDDDDAHDRLSRGEHPAGDSEPEPSERKRGARQRAGHGLRAFRAGGARAARDVGGAFSTLGTPPGYGSTKRLALTALWGVLGLSMLYLLLSDAESPGRGWPSAVQTFVGSLTTAVMAIVRPVDPLRPHAAAPAPKRAAPVHVARTPTSGPTPLPPRRTSPPIPRRPAHR